jgi:hypothetical protein
MDLREPIDRELTKKGKTLRDQPLKRKRTPPCGAAAGTGNG